MSAVRKGSCLQRDAAAPFKDAHDGLGVGVRGDILGCFGMFYTTVLVQGMPQLRDPGPWHHHSFQMRLMQSKAW